MQIIAVILSGLLCGALYAFPDFAFLSWLCLVPYFCVVYRMTEKGACIRLYGVGFLFSISYYITLFHWFWYQYDLSFLGFSPGQNIAYILFAWIGLSTLYSVSMALLPVLFALTVRWGTYRRAPYLAPAVIAALWAVIEWTHSKTWMGVPWGKLAVTQRNYLPVLQSVSFFGSYFISFLVVLVNALLAIAVLILLKKKRTGLRRASFVAGAAAVLVLANLIFGAAALSYDRRHETGEAIPVALLQGNLISGQKWNYGLESSYRLYEEMVLEAAASFSPKMIFFPESAFTVELSDYPNLVSRLSSLAKECDAYLFVGALDRDGEEYYNVICLFSPDGEVSEERYKKQHLVPFGEYLPMRGFFEAVIPMMDELNFLPDDLTTGDHSVVFETEMGGVGSLICFDSIYELLSLDSVRSGAELLSISTNDSWFLDSAAIYEHNGQAVLRAIETRRYITRTANSGLSAVISPRGEIIESLAPLREGIVRGEIVMRSDTTLYVRTGNLFIALLHIFLYGIPAYFLVLRLRDAYEKRRSPKNYHQAPPKAE